MTDPKLAEPNRYVLIGYLEEALPAEEMARIEEQLRAHPSWRAALQELQGDVDQGEHSVAMIWRRNRLTCLSRERLGAYLAGALPPEEEDYAKFHLETVACRWCHANVDDLKAAAAPPAAPGERRQKFLQTSIGQLPKKRK
jgi:hypothetical protein